MIGWGVVGGGGEKRGGKDRGWRSVCWGERMWLGVLGEVRKVGGRDVGERDKVGGLLEERGER